MELILERRRPYWFDDSFDPFTKIPGSGHKGKDFYLTEAQSILDRKEPSHRDLMIAGIYLDKLMVGPYAFQDKAQGVKLLSKFAQSGCIEAKILLGYCYDYGLGVLPDAEKAFQLYLEAAEDDAYAEVQVVAQYNTAVCLFFGLGTKEDKEEASSWLFEVDDYSSCYTMKGYCCQLGIDLGIGIEQSFEDAFDYYCMAAEWHDPQGMFLQGLFLIEGIGCRSRPYEGLKLIQQAAPDSAQAAFYLYHILGAEDSDAVKYLRYAAQLGLTEAQYLCGKRMVAGDGCAKNTKMGLDYLRQASNKGHKAALKELAVLQPDAAGAARATAAAVPGAAGAAATSAKVKSSRRNKKTAGPTETIPFTTASGPAVTVKTAGAATAAGAAGTAPLQELDFEEELSPQCQELLQKGRTFQKKEDWKQAVACFTQAVEMGSDEALWLLGSCFYQTDKPKKACQYLTRLARKGNREVAWQLAQNLYQGRGGYQDYGKAVRWLKQLALDMPQAACLLGKCYEEGTGVSVNWNDARKWYQKAADAGYGQGFFALYRLDPDAVHARELLARAVELKCADALFYSGCKQLSAGLTSSRKATAEKAKHSGLEQLQQAAGMGHAQAMFCLGLCCEGGIGTQADSGQASCWYQQALDAGCNEAMLYQAKRYLSEENEQSEIKAVALLQRAADNGFAEAEFALALCLLDGIGIKDNRYHAVKWIGRAAEQHYAPAEFFYGICFRCGDGVPLDWQQGNLYLKQSAEHGCSYAQELLDLPDTDSWYDVTTFTHFFDLSLDTPLETLQEQLIAVL